MGRKGDGSTLSRVRSVSRAIAVLRAFDRSEPDLLLRTIAERAELDAATTRRLLVTLADEGLVAHDTETSRYRLTSGLLLLAGAVSGGLSLRDFAHDHLVALSERTGTTVFLSAFVDGSMMCLDKVHGGAPVDIKWWGVNESLPMNCGAAPKLILAYLPEDQARDLTRPENFVALSPHSVMDPDVLQAQLAEARNKGWMMSLNDVSDGLSALAAPVLNAKGGLVAALSLGGLTPQIDTGEPPERLAALLDCAKVLSEFCQSQSDDLPL
jgi:DNA-binding IclR family transcriptional regulator